MLRRAAGSSVFLPYPGKFTAGREGREEEKHGE